MSTPEPTARLAPPPPTPATIVDTTAPPAAATPRTILAEVCKEITNPDPSGNGYYAVYTDMPRGNAGYCAWHSAGTCGGVVQFAFFLKLDGDAGCDPEDTSGLHSQGLAALANVSGHELSEARSDPSQPGAWYDSSGEENGDKCAWTFGAPSSRFTNGTSGRSRASGRTPPTPPAPATRTVSGQKGCLSGQ